ncbi:uncharacterized protein LDX57_007751 [Aspergillus melleus]|uniref:uncharacterized protein n=1 Tax=Aspergillus melleus TaxID=138277 RepID=UPI001E8D9353|nr:uncharacterized protein LDX57_007751 [Aspergillus melleus]KAH8430081.1 hypothetical protein LDX57_007751 [Aspergillus melleus]
MSSRRREVAGRTMWFEGEESPPVQTPEVRTNVHPDTVLAGLSNHFGSKTSSYEPTYTPREIPTNNPWQTYKPCARTVYGEHMVLAQHRQRKAEFVHIQDDGTERPIVSSWVQALDQNAHRSFRRLVDVMQHHQRYFLIWEPIEFSVSEVLASTCEISESEIVQIIRPVLEGIAFLHSQGRVLQSLAPRDILVTASGEVKIAGVEHSRECDTSPSDAAAPHLAALVMIATKLMEKNRTAFPWSLHAQEFSTMAVGNPFVNPVDALLKHPFLHPSTGQEGLWLLISVANKTAYHAVMSLRDWAWHNRLGLRIDPNEVRLQPAPQDGYVWSVTDSKAHLLETPLSNGTVGLYEEICRELGHSLEAVRPAVLQADHDDLEKTSNGDGRLDPWHMSHSVSRLMEMIGQTENEPVPTPEDDSFTASIQRLEQENQQLDDENERLRDLFMEFKS